jgi:hypothetical protein
MPCPALAVVEHSLSDFNPTAIFDFIPKTTLEIPTANMASTQSVQCFGKKKTATAVAHCRVKSAPILILPCCCFKAPIPAAKMKMMEY